MKSKKKLIIIIISIILILGAAITYYIFTKQDRETILNLLDKQWIDSNKNKVFDVSVINNIPIYNYKGNGIFFEFLNALETNINLDLNPISYSYGADPSSDYAFKITKNLSDKDILIDQDYYVLVSKDKNKYNSLEAISNVKIGVLQSNIDELSKYIGNKISYVTFKNNAELIGDLASASSTVDLIAIPRIVYLEQIINNNLNIVYSIPELKEYYVLSLGDNNRLNSIITKYFNKWYKENYSTLYASYLNQDYFQFALVDENSKAKLKGKSYVYGFVSNAPYDLVNDGKLLGLNSSIIKEFTSLADVDLEVKKYNSITTLLDAFNSNDVDFIFNNYSNTSYSIDTYETTSINNEKVVIASNVKNNIEINSINSLLNKEVMVVSDTKIEETLSNNGNKVKKYKNLNELTNNINDNSILALDYNSYYFYSKTILKNYKIDYEFTLNSDYTYIMRDINDNKLFNEYFNFYLSFIDEKNNYNDIFTKLFSIKTESSDNKTTPILLLSLVTTLLVVIVAVKKIKVSKPKKKKRKNTMSKSEKLRYIDVLTSLKNRNYLNDHIEVWDDSEVYPQTIIIVDLNNVAYINDNYGHQEGDNVIKEAANILIKNQIDNTEIIRTNGNEFLIYMVGYDERQVAAYLKRLIKELKELPHGFGAAAGYSMVVDALKTIDDAVNEATIDMRNNKEENAKSA